MSYQRKRPSPGGLAKIGGFHRKPNPDHFDPVEDAPSVATGYTPYQRKRSVSVNDRGHVVGQGHHRSRLSDHDVDLIVSLRDSGMALAQIAEKFEISIGYASDLCRGRYRGQLAVGQKLVAHREPRFRPARGGDFDELG